MSLKIEALTKIQEKKICLNPYCSFPKDRVFTSPHAHEEELLCLNWIIRVSELKGIDQEQSEGISFNFGRTPLQENLKSCRVALNFDWESYFSELKEQIKISLSAKVDEAFKKIQQKENVREFATRLSDTLVLIGEVVGLAEQSEEMETIIRECFGPWANRTFQFKAPTVQKFSSLLELRGLEEIFYEDKIIGDARAITSLSNKHLMEFMLNDPSPFNKLQQVAAMCKKKVTGFNITGKTIKLECPFCGDTFVNKMHINCLETLKKKKKETAELVQKHILAEHLSIVEENILPKICPQYLIKPRISYAQALEEVKQYSKLRIIDRESGINPKQISNDCYSLQIMCKTNESMSKNRYILTEDRKVTELLIYFMIVEVCRRKILNIKDITLESKSCSMARALSLMDLILPESKETQKENIGVKEGKVQRLLMNIEDD